MIDDPGTPFAMTYYSRNLVLQHALNLVQTYGVAPDSVLEYCGISEQSAWQPGGFVPTERLIDLIEHCAAMSRRNWIRILIGLAIVVLGYVLMSGGGNGDPNAFDAKELFSARRITVAPIVVIAGYLFIAYAILKKSGGSTNGQ